MAVFNFYLSGEIIGGYPYVSEKNEFFSKVALNGI